MMEPGRERDAAVHRALWPEEKVEYLPPIKGDSEWHGRPACWRYWREGEWRALPHYTIDLSAWPAIPGEWSICNRDNKPGVVFVEVEWEKWDDPQRRLEMLTYAETEIGDGTWQAAAAFALALCVLQWAERGGE